MKRENILVILYEMAMTIGGETRLQPLLTRTLQRLLYHTSFPAGFVCLDLPPPTPGEETLAARLDAVVGDYDLAGLAGQSVHLPSLLLRGAAERAEDETLLARLPGVSGRYRAFLRLPIDGSGAIVLLAPQMPETDLPLTNLFQPMMANLAKAIVLCRHHEAYDAELVAEREQAEQEVARAKELLERMFESIHVLVAYMDRDFNFIRVNRAYAEADGHTPDYFAGKNHFALYPNAENEVIFRRVVESGKAYVTLEKAFEYAEHPERGVSYWDWRVEPVRDPGGRIEGVILSLLDVTERVHARQALEESEEKFRRISASAQDAVIMLDDDGNIVYWNPAAERIFGYRADEAAGRGLHTLFAPARYRDAYEKGFARFRDTGEGPVIGKTLELEALRRDGTEFPVELSVSALKLKGHWHAVGILRDVTDRRRAEIALRENLVETIRAIALTVEKRDPYTAGHQQRVSELCVAIARELGLEAGRVEGLRLGALIHDIGKVYIPAEILNRPGRLTGPEFEMIKSHPEVGYDIVKDVKFPWPVAQMILQHHERLDGSGYPNGLKGEAIILEARILAVADVVEAMSSHRPYRPVVGMDKALAEIEANRGKLFDPAGVDACARLFREKRFSFQGPPAP